MGGKNYRFPLFLRISEEIHNYLRSQDIKPRGGFIKDDDVGIMNETDGYPRLLLLSGGELGYRFGKILPHLKIGDQLFCLFLDYSLRQMIEFPKKGEELTDREVA